MSPTVSGYLLHSGSSSLTSERKIRLLFNQQVLDVVICRVQTYIISKASIHLRVNISYCLSFPSLYSQAGPAKVRPLQMGKEGGVISFLFCSSSLLPTSMLAAVNIQVNKAYFLFPRSFLSSDVGLHEDLKYRKW